MVVEIAQPPNEGIGPLATYEQLEAEVNKSAELLGIKTEETALEPAEEPKKEEEGEPTEEMTHGEKSWNGRLKVEEARLKAEKDVIEAEKLEIAAAKAAIEKAAQAPKVEEAQVPIEEIAMLTVDEFDTPELPEAYNALAKQFNDYRKATEAKFAALTKEIAEAKTGAEVATRLEARETQSFMASEGAKAVEHWESAYKGVPLAAEEVWPAVARYASMHPDFNPQDPANYSKEGWLKMLRWDKASDLLDRHEAKEKGAQGKPASPPASAHRPSAATVTLPGNTKLMGVDDIAEALRKLGP